MSNPQRIAVNGEFTVFNAQPIRDQWLAALAEATNVEVDLSQVSEIDSTGLQMIVAALKEAMATQKSIRFVNHSAAVTELLTLVDPSTFLDAEKPAPQGGEQP